MAKLLKLRRGTTSQHSSFTGAEGEVTVDTTKDTLVVHDGSTAGGVPLAKESAALSLIDEDNMSTDSATRPPSQQSVKAYVDGKVPTSITVADESSDTTCFPLFVTAATGDLAPKTGTNITFNASTGKLVVGGDLQVQGTTTTVDSTTMTVADKNIEIAKGAANDAAADGAGITIDSGDGDKTWNWVDATDAWTSSEHIHLGDNKKLLIGTGSDLSIHHNGTNSYIDNNYGHLTIRTNVAADVGSNIYLQPHDNEDGIVIVHDGAVELYHDNFKSFNTTDTGIHVWGPEGTASQIYMYADDGDDNADKWRIQAPADGSFSIQNYASGSWENSIEFNGDGNVELYYDNSKKLETTSSGVTVSGSVTDDKGPVRRVVQAYKSSAHTLVVGDAGKCIQIATGGVTVNPSIFTEGDAVTIVNHSGSDQTITQGSSFTLYNAADGTTGNRTLAGRGMATLWFSNHNAAYISGAGLS